MGPSIKQAQQVPNDQAKLVAWILGGQSGLPPLLYSLTSPHLNLANNCIFCGGICKLLLIIVNLQNRFFPFSFMLGVDRNCAKFKSLKSPPNEQEPIESHLHASCCAYQTLETI